jgi:hypothetical protein
MSHYQLSTINLISVGLNIQRVLAQRSSDGDLSPTVTFAHISFPLLPLAAQVATKSSALRCVRINMLVKRFMADGQLCLNLLFIPLQT